MRAWLNVAELTAGESNDVREERAATSQARRKGDNVRRWPNLACARDKREQASICFIPLLGTRELGQITVSNSYHSYTTKSKL